MGATEIDEPTLDDLDAIAGWTWDGYVRQYQDFVCEIAAREERGANWAACGVYGLDVDVERNARR